MIGNKIKGLGEIVLRVNDMESMKNFYRETIGFELMHESDGFTFFKIADGVGEKNEQYGTQMCYPQQR